MNYTDAGSDKRLLPAWLGAWFQALSIIYVPPRPKRWSWCGWYFTFHLRPFFVMAEKRFWPKGQVRRISIGMMWRQAQQYFMFEAAFKWDPDWEPDYFNLHVQELKK